jgi:hypothetical protein
VPVPQISPRDEVKRARADYERAFSRSTSSIEKPRGVPTARRRCPASD